MDKINTVILPNLIFPDTLDDIESILAKYPPRVLPEGAMVTRFAPSPTGFLHIGGVYSALVSERLAHQTDGVYYVRVEDTDQKRKLEGADDVISSGLECFGLKPDEGLGVDGMSGDYGPYRQSERELIYKAFLKKMVVEGKAYPCFATESELDDMRVKQSEMKLRPGYYGTWAKWRDADPEIVKQMLEAKKPFVLRFRSNISEDGRVVFDDLVKGRIEMQDNDVDIVLMKSDGLPTYHFAHAVDDSLMRTTHVIRADEWVPSVPIHLQLTKALDFKRMKYGHVSPITKIDENGKKRKISKRKDPEANVTYYQEKGYPSLAVIEYLMNLASSAFEGWRKGNKERPYTDYRITFKSLSKSSNPLFDEAKLRDISKDIISRITTVEFYDKAYEWASKYDKIFYKKLAKDKAYWMDVFSIERSSGKRKDIATWSEVYENNSFFDLEGFQGADWGLFETVLNSDEVDKIKKLFIDKLDELDEPGLFMNFSREVAKDLGLAESILELKASNGKLRGHVGLVSQVVRFAITGRTTTPDLFQIIQVLGLEESKKRLAQ